MSLRLVADIKDLSGKLVAVTQGIFVFLNLNLPNKTCNSVVDRLLGLKCVKSHCISLHAAICTMYVRLVVFVDAFRGKVTSLSVFLSPRFRLGTKGNVSADAKMLAMLSFSCPSLPGFI